MKRRFFIAIMAALTATASGCAAKGIDDSKNVKAISEDQSEAPADEKSEQNDNEEDIMTKNITVDELKSKVGLSDDEYTDEELEDFILGYDITSENIDSLNIELLLDEYFSFSDETEGIFNGLSGSARNDNFTEGITAIAFYENKGTSSECVYYDFESNTKYHTTDTYKFSDMTNGETEKIKDANALVEELYQNGLWQLKSRSDDYAYSEEGSMELAVFYDDGSCFNIAIDNISKNAPDNYEKLKTILIS